MIQIKIFNSLKNKITLFLIIMLTIPLIAVGAISYIKSSSIIKEKVSISNLNTLKQTANNLDFIIRDVENFSLYLIQNDSISDFLKTDNNYNYQQIQHQKTQVNRELMYLLTPKDYIHSVHIFGFNGLDIRTRGSLIDLNSEITHSALNRKGGVLWFNQELLSYDGSRTNVISLIRIINDINNISNQLGFLLINIPEESLKDLYNNSPLSEKEEFFIINQNQKIISSSNSNDLNNKIPSQIVNKQILDEKQGYYNINYKNEEYLLSYYTLDNIEYTMLNLVPVEELLIENQVIQNITILSILISLLFAAVAIYLFNHSVLKPLDQVNKVMHELKNENFNIRLNISGHDEIAVLGKTFNKMSEKLQNLMEQVYLEKIKQKEAELKALQAQIDPHFLYNTLDTIYWMSRMENSPETSNLIKALAKLFRLSLNKGEEFTTVEKELEHLENYITIQKKRYEGMISFSINVEEELLDYRVVKLVLQPLVENAIYHGINQKNGKGNIEVNIKKENEFLIYEVIDDGTGIKEKEMKKLLNEVEDNNRGLGIKNVNDRIKLYFDEHCGLFFYNNQPGTKVVVKQKLSIKEDSNV